MALIKCPECGRQVSNIAQNCPSCGFPLGEKFKKEKAEIRNIGIVKSLYLIGLIFGFFMFLAAVRSASGIIENMGLAVSGLCLFVGAIISWTSLEKKERILDVISVILYLICMAVSTKMINVSSVYLFIEFLSGLSGILALAHYKNNKKN